MSTGELRDFPDPINLGNASSPIAPAGIDPVVRTDDLTNRNQARSGHWAFQIQKLSVFNFFVRAGPVPGLSLEGAVVPNPFTDYSVPGDKPVFEDLEVTVQLDERWESWLELQRWIRGLGFPKSWLEYQAIQQLVGWSYSKDRETAMGTLSIMTNASPSSSGLEVIRIKFHNLKPKAIGAIVMNTEDKELEFTARFSYSHYDAELVPQGFGSDTGD